MHTRVLVGAALVGALALLFVQAPETYADDRFSPQDVADERWLEERLTELKLHLARVNPDLAEQVSVVRDVQLLTDPRARKLPNGKVGFRSGQFSHSTGVLSVGTLDSRRERRDRSAMLMTLIHEMAHAVHGPVRDWDAHTPHDGHWNEAWRELLLHATRDLGWEVEVRCAECTYYGLCSQDQCPSCVWAQTTCAPHQGGSPSDFKRREAHMQRRAATAAPGT